MPQHVFANTCCDRVTWLGRVDGLQYVPCPLQPEYQRSENFSVRWNLESPVVAQRTANGQALVTVTFQKLVWSISRVDF